MSLSKKTRAFTLAETLVALGLVGILCVTMLSLNSMSDNKYKVASVKLAKADSALKSWGKAISKSNETGFGASGTVFDQNSLENSLISYLNRQDGIAIRDNDKSVTVDGFVHDNLREFQLTDGTKISAEYITADSGSIFNENQDDVSYEVNTTDSPLAVITVEVPISKNGSEMLSEEYLLQVDGIQSLASVYEGAEWHPTTPKIEDGKIIYEDSQGNPIVISCPEEGCPTNPPSIFVKDDTSIPCPIGQTGNITTRTIGTSSGTYDVTERTCCDAPRVRNSAHESCECPDKFAANAGYIVAKDEPLCQKPVNAGAYAASGSRILCGHTQEDENIADDKPVKKGYYCPQDGMTQSLLCPKGFYCPNATAKDKDTNKYHPDVFTKKNNKDVIYQGGLIDPIKCPAGSYCPEGSITPTICPAGSYCPEGSDTPIKCPAGSFSTDVGADDVTDCVKCPAGTYEVNGECKPCEGNTYQPLEGQTVCLSCPEHSSIPSGITGATSIAACKCDAGYAISTTTSGTCPTTVVLNGSNSCTKTDTTHFSPAGNNCAFSCPANSRTAEAGASSIDQCLCNEGYFGQNLTSDKKIQTGSTCSPCAAGTYDNTLGNLACTNCECNKYQNQTGQRACKNVSTGYYPAKNGAHVTSGATTQTICPAGKKCPVDNTKCNIPIDCSAGTYQNQTGQTVCKNCECNKYQDLTGQTSCKAVTGGKYPAVQNADKTFKHVKTAATSAQDCPKGKKCPMNATTCNKPDDCPAGTYQDETGKTTCKTCTTGHYCPTTGMETPTACGCNEYQGKTGQTKCDNVTAGKYPAVQNADKTYKHVKTAATSAQACPKGKKCPMNATTCNAPDDCAAGTYQNQTGQTECINCAIGDYQNATGQTACKKCTDFRKYTTTLAEGSTSTDQCLCVKGYRLNGQQCDACAIGLYKDKVSNATACDNCLNYRKNTTTLQKASTDKTQCLCDKGYRLNGQQCDACAIGLYKDKVSNATACDNCLDYRKNTTTLQAASTDKTQCLCDKGYRLNGQLCDACGIGWYKDEVSNANTCKDCNKFRASTSTTGKASTSTDQCLCVAGKYLANNECVDTQCAYYSDKVSNEQTYCGTNANTDKDSVYAPAGSTTKSACKTRENAYKFTDSNQQNHCGTTLCNANYNVVPNSASVDIGQGYKRTYTTCKCNLSAVTGKVIKETKNESTGDVSKCWYVCAPGYYGDGKTCTPCPANTYKVGDGNGSQAAVCLPCPKNSTAPAGSDTISACKCNAGYISRSPRNGNNLGTARNTDFASATKNGNTYIYKDSANNQIICDYVTCGWYKVGNTSNAGGTECPAGTYTSTGKTDVDLGRGASAKTECKNPDIGYKAASNRCNQECATADNFVSDGNGHCYCDKGFKYNPETKKCVPCEKDTYKDVISNDTSCKVCRPNSITEGTGAKSPEECLCNPGYRYAVTETTDASAPNAETLIVDNATVMVIRSCEPCHCGMYKVNLGNDKMCKYCGEDKQQGKQMYTSSTASTSCQSPSDGFVATVEAVKVKNGNTESIIDGEGRYFCAQTKACGEGLKKKTVLTEGGQTVLLDECEPCGCGEYSDNKQNITPNCSLCPSGTAYLQSDIDEYGSAISDSRSDKENRGCYSYDGRLSIDKCTLNSLTCLTPVIFDEVFYTRPDCNPSPDGTTGSKKNNAAVKIKEIVTNDQGNISGLQVLRLNKKDATNNTVWNEGKKAFIGPSGYALYRKTINSECVPLTIEYVDKCSGLCDSGTFLGEGLSDIKWDFSELMTLNGYNSSCDKCGFYYGSYKVIKGKFTEGENYEKDKRLRQIDLTVLYQYSSKKQKTATVSTWQNPRRTSNGKINSADAFNTSLKFKFKYLKNGKSKDVTLSGSDLTKYLTFQAKADCIPCPCGTYKVGKNAATSCKGCPDGTWRPSSTTEPVINVGGKTYKKPLQVRTISDADGNIIDAEARINEKAPDEAKGNPTTYPNNGNVCFPLPPDKVAYKNKCDYGPNCPYVSGTIYHTAGRNSGKGVTVGGYSYACGRDKCCCPSLNAGSIDTKGYSKSGTYVNNAATATGGGGRTNMPYVYCPISATLWDPLVIDLLNNGLKFTDTNGGVKFDLDADGIKDQVAWTTIQTKFDDAFLVYDKNANGQIDDGAELFGNQLGEGADDGLDELWKYDVNGDNVIDKNDDVWDSLRVWCDMDQNGVVTYLPEPEEDDAGNIILDSNGVPVCKKTTDDNDQIVCVYSEKTEEIKTLDEVGISKISLDKEIIPETAREANAGNGNFIIAKAKILINNVWNWIKEVLFSMIKGA